MTEKEHKNYLSRLELPSGNRDLYPWFGSPGFSSRIAGWVRAGQLPRREMLDALQRVERVSLPWPQEDRGVPYWVQMPRDKDATRVLIENLFGKNEWQTVLAVEPAHAFVAILHRHDRHSRKNKETIYRRVEVIAPLDMHAARRLPGWPDILQLPELATEEFHRLESGQMGNRELFGFQNGRKQAPGLIDRVRDLPADYLDRSMNILTSS